MAKLNRRRRLFGNKRLLEATGTAARPSRDELDLEYTISTTICRNSALLQQVYEQAECDPRCRQKLASFPLDVKWDKSSDVMAQAQKCPQELWP
ncbi:hypothetical protein C0Q70_09396 [Pomacea canaliculata]|uniref:Uncharacterized protein n=1 Tax=Pomacea canaliculata TaxID=400727 RepID=A0A2T7P9N9_POMCA|nr:hypothetical protein C0Q70_09396 [Pomacea canaliculata]